MHWSPRFIPLPEPRVSARLELAESQYHSITETIQRSHHRANESNLAHQNWMVEIQNIKQVSGLGGIQKFGLLHWPRVLNQRLEAIAMLEKMLYPVLICCIKMALDRDSFG